MTVSYLVGVLEALELAVVVGCLVGMGAGVGVGLGYECSHWFSCEASFASVATQGVDHRSPLMGAVGKEEGVVEMKKQQVMSEN